MSLPAIKRLFFTGRDAPKDAGPEGPRGAGDASPKAREPDALNAHPMEAWVASMDKFIAEQSTASKATAWLKPGRRNKALDQRQLCRTFRGCATQKQIDKGYCFALTALWLHETAYGRQAQLMQKLQAFCGARSVLSPRKKRRERLRDAMAGMETLNRRQYYGAHALDKTHLHRQKIIIGHIDADALVDLMVQNLEHLSLWEISSANHTIGISFTRASCVVYDPNDPDGTFEATRDARVHLVSYLQHALRFPEAIGEQPITLTAFAPTPSSRATPTHLAGVSQDNVNLKAPAGKSVADMTLRFMPAQALLGLVTRFDVPVAREQAPMLAYLIGVDRAYLDVLVAALRSGSVAQRRAENWPT